MADSSAVAVAHNDTAKIFLQARKLSDRLEKLREQIRTNKVQMKADSSVLRAAATALVDDEIILNNSCMAAAASAAAAAKPATSKKEQLHQVIRDHTKTLSQFESLRRAAATAQKSVVMARKLALPPPETGGGDGAADADGQPGAQPPMDPVETQYIRGLLDEQQELVESILEQFEQTVKTEMELLDAKAKLANSYHRLKDLHPDLCERRGMGATAANKTTGKTQGETSLDEKKAQLKLEEDKLTQMKFVIQKLMTSIPGWACDGDDEAVNEEHKEVIFRCGMTIEELRGDGAP